MNSTLLSVGCNLEECCSSPCTVIQSKMFVSSLQGYTQLSTVRNNGAGQLITRHTHKSQINACTQEHSLLLDCFFFYLIFFISYTFLYLLFKITNIRQDNYTSYRWTFSHVLIIQQRLIDPQPCQLSLLVHVLISCSASFQLIVEIAFLWGCIWTKCSQAATTGSTLKRAWRQKTCFYITGWGVAIKPRKCFEHKNRISGDPFDSFRYCTVV